MRQFRLLKDHHSCKLWTLLKGQITPPLKSDISHQLDQFPDSFWEEVFQCKGCNILINHKGLCNQCLKDIDIDDIDISQPIRILLPELKKLRETVGSSWNNFQRRLIAKERSGQKRDTILKFLEE